MKSLAQNIALVSPLSLEEIRSAMKSSDNNKAPGLEGFTTQFFLKYWSFFRNDFHRFNECHSNGHLNSCTKENFICFI